MPDVPVNKRRSTRYRCSGGVELRRAENAPPIWANLSDVSLEGCYVEAVSTLPSGAEVVFLMPVQGSLVRGRARIKTSHHAVGMGLEFLHLSPEDQHGLDFVVGTLAGTQEMLDDEKRVHVPEYPAENSSVTPATRTAPTASMAPPPRQQQPAPVATSGMSQKIIRSIADLNELEQNLVKDRIDPRLIAQLHDAVEHVRQTAGTVQQWVDLHNNGGDPFDVLPQLEAERMHMLKQLAHNVTADIDATTINNYTMGISELYTS